MEYSVIDHMKDAGWAYWRLIEPTKIKAVGIDSTITGRKFLYTLPHERNQELISLNFKVVTDTTSIGRHIKVIISDPATTVFAIL